MLPQIYRCSGSLAGGMLCYCRLTRIELTAHRLLELADSGMRVCIDCKHSLGHHWDPMSSPMPPAAPELTGTRTDVLVSASPHAPHHSPLSLSRGAYGRAAPLLSKPVDRCSARICRGVYVLCRRVCLCQCVVGDGNGNGNGAGGCVQSGGGGGGGGSGPHHQGACGCTGGGGGGGGGSGGGGGGCDALLSSQATDFSLAQRSLDQEAGLPVGAACGRCDAVADCGGLWLADCPCRLLLAFACVGQLHGTMTAATRAAPATFDLVRIPPPPRSVR